MTSPTETELSNAELTAKLALVESRLELLRTCYVELAEDIDGTHDRVDRVRSALHVAAHWLDSERKGAGK